MQRLEVKFATDEVDEKTGAFSGYGAVFGNVDSYGDVIKKGAFKSTLRDWRRQKKMPPMLLQHGGWMMTDTDALPIGVWEGMEEDDTGLHVKGRLINLDTDLGKRIHGAMREGVLDGMSIGYRAKKFTLGTKPEEPRRMLEEIDLVELSVVTFPANGMARVQAVKNLRQMDANDFRELEATLRDEGLSRSDAVKAIAGFKAYSRRDGENEPDPAPRDEVAAAELAELFRRNIATLKA